MGLPRPPAVDFTSSAYGSRARSRPSRGSTACCATPSSTTTAGVGQASRRCRGSPASSSSTSTPTSTRVTRCAAASRSSPTPGVQVHRDRVADQAQGRLQPAGVIPVAVRERDGVELSEVQAQLAPVRAHRVPLRTGVEEDGAPFVGDVGPDQERQPPRCATAARPGQLGRPRSDQVRQLRGDRLRDDGLLRRSGGTGGRRGREGTVHGAGLAGGDGHHAGDELETAGRSRPGRLGRALKRVPASARAAAAVPCSRSVVADLGHRTRSPVRGPGW
jgi:hypothetical protein